MADSFFMISVAEQDRDVMRFLWFYNVLLDKPTVIQQCSAFGVSSSPFLLNATVKHHLEKFLATHPETIFAVHLCG